MADLNITACPHCGQRVESPPATGECPACARPLCPSADELRARIERVSRQHRRAGDRLKLLQNEYGDLQRQLQRVADSLQTGQDHAHRQTTRLEELEGERLQWETLLEEERRRRTQAEAAAAELRIMRAEDMDQYLLEHQQELTPPAELDRLRQLADAALPLEGLIDELEQQNAALRTKLTEAERSLVDAAGLVEQLSGLRTELQRLGTRYLQAREEASRLLNEKLELRAELADLADRLQDQAAQRQRSAGTEVDQARQLIRDALRRGHAPPPLPD